MSLQRGCGPDLVPAVNDFEPADLHRPAFGIRRNCGSGPSYFGHGRSSPRLYKLDEISAPRFPSQPAALGQRTRDEGLDFGEGALGSRIEVVTDSNAFRALMRRAAQSRRLLGAWTFYC